MTFQELFEQHAGIALDKQLAALTEVEDFGLSYNTRAGVISFEKETPSGTLTRSSRFQILGTESEYAGTWLWSWANEESNLPPQLLQVANQLREYGERAGIPELSEPESELDAVSGHLLSMIASGLTRAPMYYRCPYEGGAMFVLLQEPSFLKPVENPIRRVAEVFPQLISDFDIENHRHALESYLQAYQMRMTSTGRTLTASHARDEGKLTAQFDTLNRLTQLKVSL